MKGEKGQALPLAMLALTIGTLLIVPFLSHAGASIIGSRVYGETMDYRNACDAGVEHAIWRLLYDGLVDDLPNPGDQIIYQLPDTFNGVTTTVTVTANATGGGDEVGTINKTVLDSYDFDGTYCNTPDIIHVSGNVYAIVYEGSGSDGYIRTVTIAPDGDITHSAIDTLEFETNTCYTPNIIHVSGDVYAIAFRGPGNDGFLKTVTIAANGNIGNMYIDSLEFDTSNGYEPDIEYVSGDYYAIAYRGSGNDGFLKTVTIAANGNIGNMPVDTLEFDTSNGITPYIINISGDVYAIVYSGSGSDGFVATMTISPTGDISNNVISRYEFDSSNGQEPQIIRVVDDIFAIVYRGSQNDGYVITLPIESDGTIPGTITDTFEYDTSNGYYPDIITISDGVLAVAYCVPSSKGSLVTIGIATSSGGDNVYRIRAAAGDTAIQAHVIIDDITATIIFWQVQ